MASERRVPAFHGNQPIRPDPDHELGLAADLKTRFDRNGLMELYSRFAAGSGHIDALMRRTCLRALCRSFGNGITIGSNVVFRHPETFQIGDGVHIGDHVVLHGRFDGSCVIGTGTWIGSQSYFDARDLELGQHVGWGPGAKVVGSEHTGDPLDRPFLHTDLVIKPVRVGAGADIGVNAVLLPGVTIGRDAVIGAGAIVTTDVPALAKAAGVPARIIGWRDPAAADRQPTPR